MSEKLSQYRPLLLFFVIYSLCFLTVTDLFVYLLPFILSLLIAVVMKPLYEYLKRRFRFQASFSATVITLLVFLIVIGALGFVLFLVIREFIGFISTYSEAIRDYISRRNFFEELYQMAFSGDVLKNVTDIAVSVVKMVPIAISFTIITFVLTVYFLNNLSRLKQLVLDRVATGQRMKTERTIDTAYVFIRRFIRSYLILYLITFIEAAFIFYLTGVGYPLYLAFITAFADVLPVLGPGSVYLPIAIRFFLKGNYIQAVTLAIFFLITVIIRQIIEPRIVSDSVKISPIVVLSAIYFSIVSLNVWVLFYILLLVISYKILSSAGVL